MSTATYQYLGTTDDTLTCDHCGRTDLSHTVVVETIDGAGNGDEVLYLGSTCAARALSARFGHRVTPADVRRGVTAARRAALATAEAEREAAHRQHVSHRDAVLRGWGLDPRTARPSDCLAASRVAREAAAA